MRLLIVRHGIAEDASPNQPDAKRKLTAEGVTRTREAARGLASFAEAPELVLTSPKDRAKATAEIFAAAWDVSVEVSEALADGPVEDIEKLVARRRERSLMLVGHEPTLGVLVGSLCVSQPAPPFVQMKKAGCACVEIEISRAGEITGGELLWLATPGMLRKMANYD